VYNFCMLLKEKLSDSRLSERVLCYYAEREHALRTNAAFLLGAYLVLVEGWSASEAAAPFDAMGPSAFLQFRDATHVRPATFHLSLLDCFHGLKQAVSAGWFDLGKFDVHKYVNMDNPAVYDLHQVSPKFVAFRGPDCRDKYLRKPKDFTGLFKQLGVKAVVRLNEVETYDKMEFEKEGIKVHDLQFDDCTTPPGHMVDRFIRLVDETKGLVAVHCLAGLGRTGTLISLWIMTHLGWSARDCIAWLRIVRPGSVLGSQQQYLVECQRALAKKQPWPEPDSSELARAGRMAKQVQQGMLKRSDRRRSSTSSVGSVSSSRGSGDFAAARISVADFELLEKVALVDTTAPLEKTQVEEAIQAACCTVRDFFDGMPADAREMCISTSKVPRCLCPTFCW
jgi:cell division cycle 14